jgi:hypothetical protein
MCSSPANQLHAHHAGLLRVSLKQVDRNPAHWTLPIPRNKRSRLLMGTLQTNQQTNKINTEGMRVVVLTTSLHRRQHDLLATRTIHHHTRRVKIVLFCDELLRENTNKHGQPPATIHTHIHTYIHIYIHTYINTYTQQLKDHTISVCTRGRDDLHVGR